MAERRNSQPRDDSSVYGYWPLTGSFLLILILLAAIAMLFVGLVGYVYKRVGLSNGWFFAILIGSFVGSRINIPAWRFSDQVTVESLDVVAFGVRWRVPAVRHTGRVTIAVNVGGAVIPTAVSVYLVVHNRVWWHALIAIACVAAVVWIVARPIPGVGIVVPTLVPPVAAALAATIIGRPAVAALAYVGGTVGTLVGGDLLNLWRTRGLGAPVVSIGGAGTFDGIFLTGLLAVVLASL
ncbi:MAG TPA: DUF1614 domain-containing protein [Acidimicrobiales bacterium]|nr:DUF1614 domain-containing protein [Acidimicrobiales bacterium]HXZ63019.1 DUF1614 domain-containing protein [Acidimicrobiales bacterium]